MLAIQQMDDKVSISKDWFKDYNFHLVDSLTKLKNLIALCKTRGTCSFDIETTGLDNRIYEDDYFWKNNKHITSFRKRKTKYGIQTVDRVVGVCISPDGKNGYYIPLSHEPEDSGNLSWDESWELLTDLVTNCRLIGANMKFDLEFIYPLTGKEHFKKTEYEDTFLLYRTINPLKSNPAGLKHLTKQFLKIDMIELVDLFIPEKITQMKKNGQGLNFALLHPKEGLHYGCSDGIFTYKLFFELHPKLEGSDAYIYDLEKSFSNVVRKMERNRVHLNLDVVKSLHEECKQALIHTSDTIRDFLEEKTGGNGVWETLNIGSVQQLSDALFTNPEGLKLKPIPEMLNSESGSGEFDPDENEDEENVKVQYSIKDEVVKALKKFYPELKIGENTIWDLILEYRHYEKMSGSFINKFMQSHDALGDVRPSFNQMGTDTARMSSRAGEIPFGYAGVNFQGIPRDSDDDKPELFKRIRECIAARPGYVLVKLDYSGEELRVAANLSQDPIWTKSFLYEDGDVHAITARVLFQKDSVSKDERGKGKRCNFAFMYGGGAGAIQRNIGCSMEEAQRYMNNLREGVPVLMGYVDDRKRYAKKNKCIHTAFGRRIPIPTIDSPIPAIRKKAERCAINYMIQSTSADIIKLALCFVDKNIRELGWDDRVKYIMTVHDEVVYEVRPEYLMEIVRKLDEWMTLPWKLPKEYGPEWKVPLMTEPGIDINWKARYDFFKMVDGESILPKDMNEKGEYIGKLKKDTYFDSGRIYQKIPDILKSYIHRHDQKKEEKKIDPITIESDIMNDINKSIDEFGFDSNLDNFNKSDVIITDRKINLSEENSQIMEIEEIEFDQININEVLNLPEQRDTSKVESKLVEPVNHPIFEFVFKAEFSKYNAKKLKAICMLSEGDHALRVKSQSGAVIIPENKDVLISPQEFSYLCRLYGIG